jgi:hypothetical protein
MKHDDEYGRKEKSGTLSDKFPDDHLDYTTCHKCHKRYHRGESHQCPDKEESNKVSDQSRTPAIS